MYLIARGQLEQASTESLERMLRWLRLNVKRKVGETDWTYRNRLVTVIALAEKNLARMPELPELVEQ